MVEKAKRVGRVKGPLLALIHHLTQIGWQVRTPWLWIDPRGKEVDILTASPRWVGDRVARDAQDAAFVGTARTRPHDADGLQEGQTSSPFAKPSRELGQRIASWEPWPRW